MTAIDPLWVRGVAELEPTARGLRPHRLPAWARQQFPDGQVLAMEGQPSGGRIVVETTATTLTLVTHPSRVAYRGADRPRGRLDVVVDGGLVLRDVLDGGDVTEVDLITGQTSHHDGPPHTTTVTGLVAGPKHVEIWLPHNESVDLVDLGAEDDAGTSAAVTAPAASSRPVWLHHGSSISHGSNALAPTETWPAVAAHLGGVDLVNLGLGGSALLDPFLARVMRDTPADAISVKLGINIVNADLMRLRAFVPAVHGFLDTIRDGHPDTPLLVVSALFCGIHEDTPGPGAIDPTSWGTDQVRFVATGDPQDVGTGHLTLRVIRRELADLVARRSADPHLHYLDGTTLYGAADAAELPLPDGLHPGPAAHRLIGNRFAAQAFSTDGPFGRLSGRRE